jgi:integrase
MLPRGVHRVVARGREYFYFQAGRGTVNPGPRVKLPNDPHNPQFWIAVRDARGDIVDPVPTMNAVLDLYWAWASARDDLASESKRKYHDAIKVARRGIGHMVAETVRPKDIRILLDQFSDVPGTGNNLLGLLRAVSSWGLERGHFEHSITEGVKPYKSKGGHKPWTAEQCAVAERGLTGMVRRAYFLARYTGQRGSDVVRLAPSFIDEGGFRIAQKKTGVEIWCPIEDALAVEMVAWERLPGPYLRQNHGKRYGKKLLEKHFADARDKIPELAGATFHGLRGTRVVELRQRGATSTQIQDQVGMSLAMIERYCRFADKKANGKAAVVALAERRRGNDRS